MQRKLLGTISVDFDTRDQLLLLYSAFFKYLNKMEYKEAVNQVSTDCS
jgi:hypothetical protein